MFQNGFAWWPLAIEDLAIGILHFLGIFELKVLICI